MFKGFYNLTSGMLTQTRNLDVIANNMTNTATAGFKHDRIAKTTFQEVLTSRVGNKIKDPQEIGTESYITTLTPIRVNHEQGSLAMTGIPLDFAIDGDGYFGVNVNGQTLYTRNGSFMLDEEGYLALPTQGRVLDANGQPILLGVDNFNVDEKGNIYSVDGVFMAQLGVFQFADPQTLVKNEDGMFIGNQQPQQSDNALVYWKSLERSNVDVIREMTDMIACQRALQSAAQVSKIYDQLIGKTVNDVGRL